MEKSVILHLCANVNLKQQLGNQTRIPLGDDASEASTTHYLATLAPHDDQPKSDFLVCPMTMLDVRGKSNQERLAKENKGLTFL